jgi:hypothetical protein
MFVTTTDYYPGLLFAGKARSQPLELAPLWKDPVKPIFLVTYERAQ